LPKPITPLVACDVFVVNDRKEVLLVQRADNGTWCLPGGCHDLGETPKKCAERECREESGFEVEVTRLLGIYSSNTYEYVHYPWKDNQFAHVLFAARLKGGSAKLSSETLNVGWYKKDSLPELLNDGHLERIELGFRTLENPNTPAFFE